MESWRILLLTLRKETEEGWHFALLSLAFSKLWRRREKTSKMSAFENKIKIKKERKKLCLIKLVIISLVLNLDCLIQILQYQLIENYFKLNEINHNNKSFNNSEYLDYFHNFLLILFSTRFTNFLRGIRLTNNFLHYKAREGDLLILLKTSL